MTYNLHTLFTKLTAFALVLVVCVSVAACGDGPEEVATSDKKPKLAIAEQVYGRSAMRLMSSIAQLRGHYFAAKELYAKGDKKGALVHADHPVQELYLSFRQVVAERDPVLDVKIKRALRKGVRTIKTGASQASFRKLADNVGGPMMDQAFTTVHTDKDPRDKLLRAAAAATVADTAAGEYSAAVPNSSLQLVPEYQDSYGFLQHCRLVVKDLKNEVEPTERAKALKHIDYLLNGAYETGATPPETVVTAGFVKDELNQVIKGIQGSAHAKLLLTRESPRRELRAVDRSLQLALKQYQEGKNGEAYATAASTYQDRFEGLEPLIGESDLNLMLDLQYRIRYFRDRILKRPKPVVLERGLKKVRELLPDAERALGGDSGGSY